MLSEVSTRILQVRTEENLIENVVKIETNLSIKDKINWREGKSCVIEILKDT